MQFTKRFINKTLNKQKKIHTSARCRRHNVANFSSPIKYIKKYIFIEGFDPRLPVND